MPVGYANPFGISGVAGNLPVTPSGYVSVGAWARLCWRLGTGIYNRKSGESKQNRMSGRRHGVVTSGNNYVPISK